MTLRIWHLLSQTAVANVLRIHLSQRCFLMTLF